MFRDDTGGAICNQCFREKNGDGIAVVRWMTGCSFPDAIKLIGSHLKLNGFALPRGSADFLATVCTQKRMPVDGARAYGARIEGNTVVFPAYGDDGTQCTTFRLWIENGAATKGVFEQGKPAGLFFPHVNGEPYLPRDAGDMPTIIAHSLKDAAALFALKIYAVGLPGCELAAKFATLFRGARVVMLPHRNATEYGRAERNGRRLLGIAASVSRADMPLAMDGDEGDDVRDLLAKRDGEKLLRAAIEHAVVIEPGLPDVISASGAAIHPPVTMTEGRTEMAVARRFIAMHREDIRWCDSWKKWLAWDGRRWKLDDDCAVERLAKQTTDSVWREIMGAIPDADRSSASAMASFGKAIASAHGIRHLLELARSDISIRPGELDANHWLLNVQNGTLDLRTGLLREHRRDDMITRLAPVEYPTDAGEDCPHWESLIRGVLCDDDELTGYVHRHLGYSLTGEIREQMLSVWFGAGANGKSTILNTTRDILGDYAWHAPSELLMESRGDQHPTMLADLAGRRLVVCVETGDGRRLAEGLVKQLTGGDPIATRRMREDYWEFAPTHKLILATNHRPRIRGTDHGIWRRIALVPFSRRFWDGDKGETGPPELRADKTLPQKLRPEYPAILRWLVAGCLEWQQSGLRVPTCVRAATSDYRNSEDVLGQFLADACMLDPAHSTKASDVRRAYEDWCRTHGEKPVSGRRFGDYLTEMGIARRKSNGIWYSGIGIGAGL